MQHFYIWALYCLMALRWQTIGDVAAFARGRIGTSTLRMPRRWDLAGLPGREGDLRRLGAHRADARLSVVGGRRRYLVYSMIVSLIMAVTFQLAHCVEEADFASAEQLARATDLGGTRGRDDGRLLPAQRCPRLDGWRLNFQIEHHLFPRVPHTHYPQIAKIVQRNAERHGVRYVTQHSLRAALGSHYRHLRTMGRNGVPVALDMG